MPRLSREGMALQSRHREQTKKFQSTIEENGKLQGKYIHVLVIYTIENTLFFFLFFFWCKYKPSHILWPSKHHDL